ncbi:MAG: hypothetical protein JXA89_05765 [Anaerolineae bacterium]|nr:hypothetical protein [Anaerolineae bacterium]
MIIMYPFDTDFPWLELIVELAVCGALLTLALTLSRRLREAAWDMWRSVVALGKRIVSDYGRSYLIGPISIAVLCLVLLIVHGDWRKYDFEKVSRVLIEQGLIASTDLRPIEYPGGMAVKYSFRDRLLIAPDRTGEITFFRTRAELRRIRRAHASIALHSSFRFTYSEFHKGNMLITISPVLTKADADRFQHALRTLR